MTGKKTGKKKQRAATRSGNSVMKDSKSVDNSPRAYDDDTAVFISMSQDLKDEGNKLFQKRDYEGAMQKYEKAMKLLPGNHIDVSCLHSNIAACYMQMGLSEYPRAIHECNLALEVTSKYSKALLKRARCYEALNRLDLALIDVHAVLRIEPNNIMATEIAEKVNATIKKEGIKSTDIPIDLVPEHVEPPCASPRPLKEKPQKKKSKKFERAEDKAEENKAKGITDDKKVEDKVEEKKAKVTTDERKAEDKLVEENKTKAMTDEKKAEDELKLFEEKKAKGMANGKRGEEKVEEKAKVTTDDKKAEDKLVEENNAKGMTGEKKAEGKLSEEKKEKGMVNGKEADEKVEEKKEKGMTDEKKVEHKLKEKKTEGITVEKTAKHELEEKKAEGMTDEKKAEETVEEKKAEDKLVVEEKISNGMDEEPKRNVKLVFGEDIRWAQLPFNCSILKLRQVTCDRFPSAKAVLVKYRDQEGDLVTITTNEELRWAEASAEHLGSVRLYIVEVSPDQDPFYDKVRREEDVQKLNRRHNNIPEHGSMGKGRKAEMGPSCIDDWILQFAQLFKNYVGFNSDAYLDLHELGMKLYSEAMEEAVTSDEAQGHFHTAAEKFQEMAALALFNWGNVHMSRARKRVYFTEDATKESVLVQVETAYDWAQKEFLQAGMRYEEALRIKPDFYEAVLAIGQQQFEQAKLSWYYAVGTNVDLETWPATEVLQLYNNAEDNMERGMHMWEETEEQRLNELSKPNKVNTLMQNLGLDGLFKDISEEEAAEQAANMKSQIHLLWGTMLYERSIMEFKLGLPVWHECLEVSVEKFELAGASPTDIAVMIKNHCSNDTALEGLGFNIDEIVQAWNEMYEAKRWQSGVPSFRLEPLLRRRVSKLYYALENA